MIERWVIYSDNYLDCPCCSGQIEVFTGLHEKDIDRNMYLDGDAVRCMENCGAVDLQISCDSETPPYITGDW